ncbi:MAG: hypothetical protein ACK5X6_05010, partial [Chryseotalea sp.]
MKHITGTIFLVFILAVSLGTAIAQENPLLNTWKVDEKSVPVFSEVIIRRVSKVNPEQAKQLESYPDAVTQLVRSLEL